MDKKFALNTFMFPEYAISDILKKVDFNWGIGLYMAHMKQLYKLKERGENFNRNWIGAYVYFFEISMSDSELIQIEKYMMMCERLSIPTLTIIFTNKNKIDRWKNKILNIMEYLYNLATKYNIKFLIEPIKSEKGDVCFQSISGVRDIENYINTNLVKWVLDIYHIDIQELKDLTYSFVQNIYTVHLSNKSNDSKRCFLSKGTLPILDIFNKIQENDYYGWWEFEVLSENFINIKDVLDQIYHDVNELFGGNYKWEKFC